MKKNYKIKDLIIPVIFWIILFTWSAILVFLTFWAVITSVRLEFDLLINNNSFFPKMWAFDNYKIAIDSMVIYSQKAGELGKTVAFPELLWNTILYAVGTPFWAILTAAMSSYICAKYKKFRWTQTMFTITIFCTYIPLNASLGSVIRSLSRLNLYDDMVGMWIYSSGAFGSMFLLYYANFKSVSWTYAEAAFIDGASPTRVFFTIMLPLTKGIFGALYLTTFIRIWNDYDAPLALLPSYPTLSYFSWYMNTSNEPEFGFITIKMAAMVIVAVPILILFIIFKDKMMKNMTAGGLKG